MYCRDREAADINLPLSDVLTVSNQNPRNLTLAAGQIPQMISVLIIEPLIWSCFRNKVEDNLPSSLGLFAEHQVSNCHLRGNDRFPISQSCKSSPHPPQAINKGGGARQSFMSRAHYPRDISEFQDSREIPQRKEEDGGDHASMKARG